MSLYFAGLALVCAASLVAPAVSERRRMPLLFAGICLGGGFQIASAAAVLAGGASPECRLAFPEPVGVVRFAMDPIAAAFVLLVAVGAALASMYGIGYLLRDLGRGRQTGAHALFFGLMTCSMSLLAVAQHALVFLAAWEVMTLSSFILVVYEGEKEDVVLAGTHYLATMHVGAACLVAAFAMVASRAGGFDFALFPPAMACGGSWTAAVGVLFFAGFGMKAGFVPLHIWLPHAHPAAPSHVSGVMSGVMIKTGVLGILRFLTWQDVPPLWMALGLLAFAALTALQGVAHALVQKDLKKVLAYSSVENMGIVGMGLAVGALGMSLGSPALSAAGFAGGLVHALNHSLFKGLLFEGAGAVYRSTGLKNMELLGGLARRMPKTAPLVLVGCAAICGLPPLNGFAGEFLVFLGMFRGLGAGCMASVMALVAGIACLALVGGLAVMCFTRFYGVVFCGLPRSPEAGDAREAPGWMRAPMAVQACLCLLMGVFPQHVLQLVSAPVRQLSRLDARLPVPGEAALQSLSTVSLVFLGVLAAVAILRHLLVGGAPVGGGRTWDCGYSCGTPRMQYTGLSFADSFADAAKPFLNVHSRKTGVKGLFPGKSEFEAHSEDAVESRAVAPALRLLDRFLSAFMWVQGGSTRLYLLMGLVFLVLALVWAGGARW